MGVRNAKPDGYTLLVRDLVTHAINPTAFVSIALRPIRTSRRSPRFAYPLVFFAKPSLPPTVWAGRADEEEPGKYS